MSSERSQSKMKERVLRALHELFPGFDEDPEEMIEDIEIMDEESKPIFNAARNVSLHYVQDKRTYIELVLIFGDPNAVNSDGYSIADEIYIAIAINSDRTYKIWMKKSFHDKTYIRVPVHSHAYLRRRHLLEARRRTMHKGGARRRHRRSTRKH
jgi:hypothetical protein